jgi:hypothetical protein
MRQVSKGLKALYQCLPEFLGFQVEHQPSLLVMSIIGLERKAGAADPIFSMLSSLKKKQLLNVGRLAYVESVMRAHHSLNTILHIYLATGQSNAMCLMSSGLLQWGHSAFAFLPRSLVPTGSAWLQKSYINPLTLEDAKVDRCSCLTFCKLIP